ncbi:hypothetical protein [Nocardia sp. NPDC051463]|uniref:hypothetical protein n=1 Tax=Nocardia sp. NPDC051463 TaxID=3154845 RepID=UPI0034272038
MAGINVFAEQEHNDDDRLPGTGDGRVTPADIVSATRRSMDSSRLRQLHMHGLLPFVRGARNTTQDSEYVESGGEAAPHGFVENERVVLGTAVVSADHGHRRRLKGLTDHRFDRGGDISPTDPILDCGI